MNATSLMSAIILACAPFILVWAASLLAAWCTTPSKHGVLRQRRRDLDADPPADNDEIVDLSKFGAARVIALRAGSVVRGISYLLVVVAVAVRPPTPVVIVVLLIVVWIYMHWRHAAGLTYVALTGEVALTWTGAAAVYTFPDHSRAPRRNVARRLASELPLITMGVCLIEAAGLPIAFNSDTIPSPLPGVAISHTGLPPVILSCLLLAAGAGLAWMGVALDRRIRRRMMMRGTSLVAKADAKSPPVVFLRPFGSEATLVSSHPGTRREGVGILIPKRREFLEDVATWIMWMSGPVVAIADPRGGLAGTLGAAHHLVGSEVHWRDAVADLLTRAVAILLIPGTSPGVAWEVNVVAADPKLAHKTLLLNAHPDAPSVFLDLLGASPDQCERIKDNGMRVLGAVLTDSRPQLLCGTLAEDVDIESAVEWFVRRRTPAGMKMLVAEETAHARNAERRRRLEEWLDQPSKQSGSNGAQM